MVRYDKREYDIAGTSERGKSMDTYVRATPTRPVHCRLDIIKMRSREDLQEKLPDVGNIILINFPH